MGTATFAVPILEKLVNSEHSVVAIYTKAPSKQARGMLIQNSPVHEFAIHHNIDVYTPETLRNQTVVDKLTAFNADVIVVAAYGLIVPNTILNICKFGCINIHPSDLPRWRGAAPIQRTLMAGDEQTAICVMKMDDGIDTGPVFIRKHIAVNKTHTIHQLIKEYAEIGVDLLLQTLEKLKQNSITALPQGDENITYASKILPGEENINWFDSAIAIHGKIMALTPNAYFMHRQIKIKAIESTLSSYKSDEKPGTILNKNFEVVCGDGNIIKITKLQRPGGKILTTKEFICGYKIDVGIPLMDARI